MIWGVIRMVKVSVIIPVFNVEKYLGECIESISNQSLEDIEIICIDDGSTDGSLNILNEYASKDSRFKILHQDNLGPGAARNKCISIAAGEYIYFMDSDDILALNALEDLYNLSEDKKTDFIFFKIINFDDETGEKTNRYYYDMPFLKEAVGESVFNYKDIKEFIFDLPVSAPAKFFNKEFVSDIKFPEGILFEDNIFFIEAIFKSDRLYFYDEYLYDRRIHKASITNSFKEGYLDFLEMNRLLVEKVKELGKYEEFKDKLYHKKLYNIYDQFQLLDEDSKPIVYETFKEDLLSYKDQYESDDVFLNEIDERLRCIYYSCIYSENYREFELMVDNFDLNREVEKLKKVNKTYLKTIRKLKKQNEEFESSKMYKVWNKIAK